MTELSAVYQSYLQSREDTSDAGKEHPSHTLFDVEMPERLTHWRLTFCYDRDSGGDHNSPGDTTKCTVPLCEGRGRNRAKGRRDF